ncbi:hypothetical protein NDI45_12570 [Leptolyngbya sp. GB1-A1]|uniref:hypothetical protein n=1 Tax=Leptolyngbya sp. GB1-A1 TaxID=2933908 RepID=UPI00329A4DEE
MNRPDLENSWAKKSENLEEDNLLWRQYNVFTDLFKFYVNTTWQVITWFYAITGAILVYYFDHAPKNPHLRYALLLPAVLSFGFSQIFKVGARQNKDLADWLDYIRSQLNLPGRPHVEILHLFLEQSSKLFLVVTIGLIIAFVSSFFNLFAAG